MKQHRAIWFDDEGKVAARLIWIDRHHGVEYVQPAYNSDGWSYGENVQIIHPAAGMRVARALNILHGPPVIEERFLL